MQNVTMTLNHLTGSGWKYTDFTYQADENLGLSQGRDVYSTARGMAINRMKTRLLHVATCADIVIDDAIRVEIIWDGKSFRKSTPMTKRADGTWDYHSAYETPAVVS